MNENLWDLSDVLIACRATFDWRRLVMKNKGFILLRTKENGRNSSVAENGEDFRLIPLTQGQFAIVDAEDYDRLAQHKWCAAKGRDTFYAHRGNGGTTVSMHRVIMRAPKDMMCDHRNHNGLNNRKSNLRLCTSAQNQYNKRPKKGSTSIYKGVLLRSDCKRWRAKIGFKGKRIHLGDFANEIQAAMAYDDKAIELFGEFAWLNFPERIDLRNWIRKIVWAA
ncbi:MAG: HNH endonuclease [Planctomycetota bacterium]